MAFTNYHTSNAFGGYHSALGNFTPVSVKAKPKITRGPAPPAAAPSLPFNAAAQTEQNNALRSLNSQNAGFNLQEQQLHEAYDDPSNPYNKIAMMKRAYDQQAAQTTNSLASRGHLYSGYAQTSQNNNAFGYSQQKDAAQRSFDDAVARIKLARQQAQDNYQNTFDAANFSTLYTGQ